jgi:hypothetical protein
MIFFNVGRQGILSRNCSFKPCMLRRVGTARSVSDNSGYQSSDDYKPCDDPSFITKKTLRVINEKTSLRVFLARSPLIFNFLIQLPQIVAKETRF